MFALRRVSARTAFMRLTRTAEALLRSFEEFVDRGVIRRGAERLLRFVPDCDALFCQARGTVHFPRNFECRAQVFRHQPDGEAGVERPRQHVLLHLHLGGVIHAAGSVEDVDDDFGSSASTRDASSSGIYRYS